MNDVPEVVEFYRTSGDVDYLLRVVVPDIAAYDAVQTIITRVPFIRRQLKLCDGRNQTHHGVASGLSLNGRRGRASIIAKLTRRHTLFTVH